jgi:hypothetical protein
MHRRGGDTVRSHLFRVIPGALTALVALATLARPDVARRLIVQEFEALHRELSTCREPWHSIPWRLSVLDATAQAARVGKPVYMLVRSGHPLGCV